MRKVAAFILLVYHVNFYMFTPQLDEVDAYDVSGKPVDDINSLYEYIDQVVLDHKDDTPEDEDDDSPNNYTIVQVSTYYCDQHIFEIPPIKQHLQSKRNFRYHYEPSIISITYDIISPPPEV